ncbi:MAG: putative molybdenum carrier protein [Planctomycetaceae bacterium]|nr:putative molybdenum carrier protein [Planctomycetaceae bacterium]
MPVAACDGGPTCYVDAGASRLDSDGTLTFYRKPLEGGTLPTCEIAYQLGKPVLPTEWDFPPSKEAVPHRIRESQIKTLNIAEPRQSTNPGIDTEVRTILEKLLLT